MQKSKSHNKTDSYPRVIVNADDFGRSREVCDGVIKAFNEGLVTSTSLVANGSAFDYAIELIKKNPGLDIGVHLALDEYLPVLNPEKIKSILKEDGRFYTRGKAFARIMGGFAQNNDIEAEWSAQVEKVLSYGVSISHLNGHGHCHALPTLSPVFSLLLKKYNIKSARVPAERLLHYSGSWSRYFEKAALHLAGKSAAKNWGALAARADHFIGFSEGGRLTPGFVDKALSKLLPGVSELMAHPSISDSDSSGLPVYGGRQDLDSLLIYSKDEASKRHKIKFIKHSDLHT